MIGEKTPAVLALNTSWCILAVLISSETEASVWTIKVSRFFSDAMATRWMATESGRV